ncbi:cell division protein SepF [Bifidobacterium magnum]|uniref:Cell division protein SepF n=1 Tax=Bifidobacterium magnum TaxID=1692 RepID=A0A087BDT9_9BIFI|nr:cell division protein SepF [Bifidobacterium magnum]KFI69189.1 hypothetical protein BMAGN_0953 [Bifidobacterium magnum]
MPALGKLKTYLGLSDVVDENDDAYVTEEEDEELESTIEPDYTPQSSVAPSASSQKSANPFAGKFNRITTIQPRNFDDAHLVGRSLCSGIPVVLNLESLPKDVALRVLDFSTGVVFGLSGSVEKVTSRVYLLSPAQVNIVSEEAQDGMARDLFSD